MGYRHAAGTTGYLINETIRSFSPNEIERYLGKTVEALRKDANPNTAQRLGYDDAIRLDILWHDRHGTRPFLERATAETGIHSSAASYPMDRTGNVLNLSVLGGTATAAVREHDLDGILTAEEIDAEIACHEKIIRNSSEAKKGLLAMRAKAGLK